MPQLRKISKNNTTVERDSMGRVTAVTLHSTRILNINWGERTVFVYTGGWNTVTTQTRLNQAFNESGIPIRVSRKGGVMRWYGGYHPESAGPIGAGGVLLGW